jgi:hypothetical protein
MLTTSPDDENIGNGSPSMAFMVGEGAGASIQEELSRPIPYLVWGKPTVSGASVPKLSNQPIGGQYIASYQNPAPAANSSNSRTNYGTGANYSASTGSGGGQSSFGQVLTSLYNVLVQISVVLASYKKS